MKHYAKSNIRIIVIVRCCAFIGWGIGAILLWNSASRFGIYMVFVMLVFSLISDYIGWKKYKNY